jgi:hypothetical protein
MHRLCGCMRVGLIITFSLLLASCGGGVSGTRYTVGGTASGLTGSMMLQNNGTSELTVSTNGVFTFASYYGSGSAYNVTVARQPTGQTCSVSQGSGTVSDYVNNVTVVCSTNSYSVSGTVSGLGITGTVVLQDNSGDNLSVATNGAFIFATAVANGSPYSVTVLTQPTGQSCSVANGTGTITLANVTNVAVTCAYTVPFGTKQMGVAGTDTYGNSVATDANGNVYVAGQTLGGLDGNSMIGTPFDAFLTQYDVTGAKLNTKQIGVTGKFTYGASVATDASGDVYVTGSTQGGLDGNILTGTEDFFLIKYDATGTKLYTKQLGEVGADTSGESVATDANGNVYVTGTTQGNLDGNTLTGTTDFFLTKYDPTGTKLYTRQLGVAGVDTIGSSVATDVSGNVYVTGKTQGNLDGNTLTGTTDFFLTKYDATGARLYTKQVGAPWYGTSGSSVATDANGNVYVTGSTQGHLDGNTLTGITDFFLAKYDVTGTKLYIQHLGVAGANTYGASVATDASGSVYVTGFTDGGLDGNTLTGPSDFFLTKYDAAGAKLYTRQMGVAGAYTYTNGYSVATDASGSVYVTGSTEGGLDGNTLTGTTDFFLVKYNSAGAKQ